MTNTTDIPNAGQAQTIRAQAEALLDRLCDRDAAAEFYVSGFVHRLLEQCKQVAIIWCVEDVQAVRPGLTDDQAWKVLKESAREHDAEIGINWMALQCMADELFPRKRRQP
jgi:hypothetical protein